MAAPARGVKGADERIKAWVLCRVAGISAIIGIDTEILERDPVARLHREAPGLGSRDRGEDRRLSRSIARPKGGVYAV